MSTDRFGSNLIGPVRFGSDRIGSDRTDLNQFGSVRFGSVRFDPVRFGPVLTMYYIPHTTYSSNVDMAIHCYRTTGTYPCIVLLLDYVYKVSNDLLLLPG